MNRRSRRILIAPRALAAALILSACASSSSPDDAASPDSSADAPADARLDTAPRTSCATSSIECESSQLDVLMVVDNSNDMSEQQLRFAQQLPAFIDALLARDLDTRIGVVTSDMGTGGNAVFTCGAPDFGDDGILRAVGNTARPGCREGYPRFLAFEGGHAPDRLSEELICVAALGTQGCGFEQTLDSMLKALTPASCPTRFVEGTTGHSDGANAGFLREQAALLVLLLSDEDDCSALDADLYNGDSVRYPGPDLNLRCTNYPEAVHPIGRYVDGLLSLKSRPGRVAFVPIVGVPADLEGEDTEVILADPRMEVQTRVDDASSLMPSCRAPGSYNAHPPRRIVSVAGGLQERGAQAQSASLCVDDYESAFGIALAAIDRAVAACEP